MFKIALIAATSLIAVSVASAQNAPPPGNVNPGSMKSGAEPSGAENQPRSKGDQMGTTGAAPAKPSQMEKDSSPSGTAGGAVGTSKDGPNPDTPRR